MISRARKTAITRRAIKQKSLLCPRRVCGLVDYFADPIQHLPLVEGG